LFDPFGLTYSESVGNDTMANIKNTYGVDAYTGDANINGVARPVIVGSHNIKETTENSNYCAKVESAAGIDVNVRTVLPTDSAQNGYTANGEGEIAGHEDRRRQVYQLAYNEYIAPIESGGYRAVRCGCICRKTPGEAKNLLTQYLDSIQQKGIQTFTSWATTQQGYIGLENYRWAIDPGSNFRDHIVAPATVPQPNPLPDDVPCPSFQ